jgi:putative copper resistance protein D
VTLTFAAAAFVVTAIVLSPPFDRLSDGSFAWHMVQHLVLLFVVPLLALLSRPFEFFRRIFGNAAAARALRALRGTHLAFHPALALGAFVGVLWLTHFSGLYEYALDHEWAHVCEHVLFVAAGLLFWTPVIAPSPVRPQPFPVRLLYLFVALPQGALLAVALEAARYPLYAHYAAVLSNAQALTDQDNAAAVMWIGGGAITFAAFLGTFGAWAARERV